MVDVNLSSQLTGANEVVKGLKEIREETRNLDKQIRDAAIAGNVIGEAITKGVGLAFQAIRNATVGVADWANQIKDMSETIGLSTGRIQQLSAAAKIAGEDAGRLQLIFTSLTAKLGDARDGSKAAAEAFQKLNIDPKQLKTSEEAFDKVKKALLDLPEGMQRTEAATSLLGRRMAVTFLQIAQEEERAKKVLQDFGLELSEKQIANLDEFSKVWATAQIAATGFQQVIALSVAPTLEQLVTHFLSLAKGTADSDDAVSKMVPHVKALGATFVYLSSEIGNAATGVMAFGRTLAAGKEMLSIAAKQWMDGDPTGRLGDRLKRSVSDLDKVWQDAATTIKNRSGEAQAAIDKIFMADYSGKGQKTGEAIGSALRDGLEKSLKTRENPFERMLEGLQKQYIELTAGKEAALQFSMATGEMGKKTDAASVALQNNVIHLHRVIEAVNARKQAEDGERASAAAVYAEHKRLRDEEADRIAGIRSYVRALEESADPTLRYQREIQKLLEIYKEFPYLQDGVSKAIKKLSEDFEKGQEKTSDFAREMASTATSALGQMIFSSAKFSDKLKALVSDIGQMIVKITILKPLAKELERIFSGGGEKKKDPISGLFGSVIGSIGEALIPKGFINMHEGSAAPALRMGNASWMQNARKLHAGLASDEFPAILQTGEKVIPRGGSAGDNIVVNQYFQAGVTRAELASILPKWKNETIAAVADKRRRGARI